MREVEEVACHHSHVRPGSGPEPFRQTGVDFDRDDVAGPPRQSVRQQTPAWADLYDKVATGDRRVGDEASGERTAPQEVLRKLRPPRRPGALPGHG